MIDKLLLFLFIASTLLSQGQSTEPLPPSIELDLQRLTDDNQEIKYDINEIITIIQDSIDEFNEVRIPDDATAYEKVLFSARRIQHNDSQLTAIKIFKYLLEFELYRTEGEELYLKFLLATSLDYIGAPYLAKEYLDETFLHFLDYLESRKLKCFFLDHYAGLLMRANQFDQAGEAFRMIIKIGAEDKDSLKIFETRNNYGFYLQRNKQYDSAAYYYRLNQNPIYKTLSPIIYAFSFGNYGALLRDQGSIDSALYYSRKEIKLLDEIPSIVGKASTYRLMAECYERLNNIDSAIYYYKLSLSFGKQSNNQNIVTSSYRKLLDLYGQKRGDKVINRLIEEYYAFKDSIDNVLSDQIFDDERQIYSYLQILNEAHLSKKRFDDLKTDNLELLYLVICLTLLMLFMLIVIVVRHRHRVALEKANDSLKEKNKDLEKSYETISETSARNETLLKELHHRVKNNLQMVISLFNLQRNSGNLDEKTTEILRLAQDRVFSIALIHKKIYQSDQFTQLNFREYLEAFIGEIINNNDQKVDVNIKMSDFHLSIDSAVPLGLIINELFTNSLKHAAPKGELIISIVQTIDSKECEFIYTDNGKGVNLEKDVSEKDNTIGMTLIKLLSGQLGATIKFKEAEAGKHGLWFSIQGSFK